MTLLISVEGTEFDPSDSSIANRGRKVTIEGHDTHLVWFVAGKFAGRIEREHVAAILFGKPLLNWVLEIVVSGRSQMFWMKEADGREFLAAWYSV
jgi:hypothetical protein